MKDERRNSFDNLDSHIKGSIVDNTLNELQCDFISSISFVDRKDRRTDGQTDTKEVETLICTTDKDVYLRKAQK